MRAQACLLLLVVACGDLERGDEVRPSVRMITIADGAATNPTYHTSYVSLLERNDDALFRGFEGADLTSRLGPIDAVRLDRAGDSFRGLADAMDDICRCAGEACDDRDCIDTEDNRPTLLIVQLGTNDLYNLFLRMASEPTLRDNPDAAVSSLAAAVRTVMGIAQDDTLFAKPPTTLVLNVPDPTDGTGDLVELVSEFIPLPAEARTVTSTLVEKIIGGLNRAVATEAARGGATLVDVHAAFLGHGVHSDEPDHPRYVTADPSHWYRGVIEPNLRGAHEVRRAIWRSLTGEEIDALPGALPPIGTLGLPEVPAHGWANAVVAARIQQTIVIDDIGEVSNVTPDPDRCLGPPTEEVDAGVALGTIGHFVVVDFGEGEAATDGDGDDLLVLEFGAGFGGVPEPYRVAVSDSATGPFVLLGDGSGERAFDLSQVGLRSARFVRVESLLHRVDLPAFGSPFFPGPEINAIGAVYPGN